jgi:hypothetical protein
VLSVDRESKGSDTLVSVLNRGAAVVIGRRPFEVFQRAKRRQDLLGNCRTHWRTSGQEARRGTDLCGFVSGAPAP